MSSQFFDTFISNLPQEQKKALSQLRTDILAAAPNADEGISTGVPSFHYHGKYLASINATKTHLSFFMMRGNVLKDRKEELEGYDATNVAIKFNADKPLTPTLVKKLITARMHEIDSK